MTGWMAPLRHRRAKLVFGESPTNAIKAQMDAPQNFLEAKTNQTPFRKQYSYLRLSRLSSCAVPEFPRIEPFLFFD
jgi:hypothetical protein